MLTDTAAAFLSPEMEPLELAIALVAGPLFAGLVAGKALRMLGVGRAPSTTVSVALLLLAPVCAAAAGLRFRMGIWDAAAIGLLGALGLISTRHAWLGRPRELLLAFAAVTLSLGAAEWAARQMAHPAPDFAAIDGGRILLPPIDLENPAPARSDSAEQYRHAIDCCTLLYPDHYPAPVAERLAHDGAPLGSVLYVGDSMVQGLGVPMHQAFPALIGRLDPSTVHVNLAFSGTSVDYHYLMARRWLKHLPPPVRLALVGLYYNDTFEIGQGVPCCNDRSLLALDDGQILDRCAEPAWAPGYGSSARWFLRHSPSPYPVRYAMQFSQLARHLEAVRYRRASYMESPDMPADGRQWEDLRLVLAALHAELAARGIPLVAVVLPFRPALEAPDPTEIEGYRDTRRIAELASSVGIRTVDPWDHLLALVRRDGSSRYFSGDRDIHFSTHGHEVMARWLLENVDELRPPVFPVQESDGNT